MGAYRDYIRSLTATGGGVELVSFVRDREELTTESRYYVKHNNGKTILEQGIVINGDGRGYKASAIITDFPLMPTEREAALKLADWLKRMGEAIEAGFNADVKDNVCKSCSDGLRGGCGNCALNDQLR